MTFKSMNDSPIALLLCFFFTSPIHNEAINFNRNTNKCKYTRCGKRILLFIYYFDQVFLLVFITVFVLDLIPTATDKTNQLQEGLMKVKIEEINSHKICKTQNNILKSEGILLYNNCVIIKQSHKNYILFRMYNISNS